MATKKKPKSYGMFKVEDLSEKVISCGNKLRVAMKFDPLIADRVVAVRIINAAGVETTVNAVDLIQAADALKVVDRTKRFVCGFHGAFISPPTSRQAPTCPSCVSGIVQAAREQQNVLDDDDA